MSCSMKWKLVRTRTTKRNRAATSPHHDLEHYCRDLTGWPRSWMGLEKDLPPGEQLLVLIRPFLEHLAASDLSPKTIQKHVDNIWVLGGEFIRDLHNDPSLRKKPVDRSSITAAKISRDRPIPPAESSAGSSPRRLANASPSPTNSPDEATLEMTSESPRERWKRSWASFADRSDYLLVLLSLLIGVIVGLSVVAFILLTGRLATRMYPPDSPAWRRVLVPTAGALFSGYLLFRYFPNARGSGIPQTKFALFVRDGYISLRTVLGKFLCCSISLASGIALGREGPSVQIGAGIASVIGRRFGLSPANVKRSEEHT